ncbi:hypothetical protein ZEAMMB73_Zm00001d013890 [Zea mays]|uniref:Uncharacterized protein n=1 Tax=Zea mays TaxID=4577 RepID=A0A1D6GN48_MAIZE|nr:hypothetical protein ZEAMMB73_Zm00001d013890 [Zea mays]
MRDPFDAPVDLINVDHNGGYQLSRTGAVSAGDHGLQNGGPKSLAPNSDTVVRHQLQGASLHKDLALEDPNTRIMDPETKELYFRSQSQEDEILLLRKKIAEASLKELSLLSEKHILERRLTDLRMAVDEKQEEAISGALKQLNQKKTHLEDNMRLANELKVEEEELYFFTSSLLSMLAEYNIRPPQINASTITIGTKRLYQQMHWKLKSLNDNLGDMPQPGNIYNSSHQQQQVTLPRNEASPSYNMVSNKNALQQYAQGPSDRHIEQMYHGSSFQQDTGGTTPSNYFEEGRVDGGSQLYPSDGDALPGIEGFQIAGEPRPGCQLTACGFPTNGTTLCNFQWVRHLENGIKQSIEGKVGNFS